MPLPNHVEAALQRLDFPDAVDRAGVLRARRDAEILAARLGEHPVELAQLLDSILRGQQDANGARQQLADLAMTEQDFQGEGGGLYWLIFVAVLLYSSDAY